MHISVIRNPSSSCLKNRHILQCAFLHTNSLYQTKSSFESAMQEAKTPVESAIESAKKTCDDGTTQECAAAWDEVMPPAKYSPPKT